MSFHTWACTCKSAFDTTLHKKLSSRTPDIRRKVSTYIVFRKDILFGVSKTSKSIPSQNHEKMFFSKIPNISSFRTRKYPESLSSQKSEKLLFLKITKILSSAQPEELLFVPPKMFSFHIK